MKETLINNIKYYQDYILFLLVVLAGIFIKIYNAVLKGKKPTLSFILAEGIISFFVAISVYALFDQFLHCNRMFTYMVCAWGGFKSTLFHDKLEELISTIFESLRISIKSKRI
ncbi:hypothetical protein [Flavobacterium laiguense]|uniref:Uncharacterized protein n=1 Tax=Flavobacterium laiguense TaxID=2169409 RepID=A0A2U1JWK7_9FLAO|nr:hypothetical protein [Flavobacterium laiguense]PWA09512.1 hypothetical protein DB891_07460 [Flavobacterium laiguense]